MRYIVTRSNMLFMMDSDDFRLSASTWGYEKIAAVTGIGKYEPVPGHGYKARRASASDGNAYLIFHDWSARKAS